MPELRRLAQVRRSVFLYEVVFYQESKGAHGGARGASKKLHAEGS